MSSTAQATPGWYDDGAGRQRWWDGARWTEHYAPQQQVAVHPTVQVVPAVISLEDRRARLAMAVAQAVNYGARVESQTDTTAVLVRGGRMNHVLHLILTLVTFGLWAIVWLIVALASGEKRQMIRVDEYGNILNG